MNSEHSVDLSLIVPLFDEAENVEELVKACLSALRSLDGSFELILVDDGSTDETGALIREAARAESDVLALGLRRRFGKGSALAAGIAQSRGVIVATIDGDLQEDPAELPKLLEALAAGADLATGWRQDRKDPWHKRLQSSVFNGLIRLSTGRQIRDLNCGFKAMRRELAEELRLAGGRFRFVTLLANWWGYRSVEVPVTHRPRQRGVSSFGGNRFPGVFIDLIAVLCLIRYHSRPGHLFIQLGSACGIGGVTICGYIAYLRLAEGTIGFRYPLLALGVLLVAIGVQLIATGFLGEWLSYRRDGQDDGYRVRWGPSDEAVEGRAAADDESAGGAA